MMLHQMRMPSREFLELTPGSSKEGTLKDKELCSYLPRPKPSRLALDIAFGYEIEKVKEAIRLTNYTSRPVESPGNPIVDWRTLVNSEPIPLR